MARPLRIEFEGALYHVTARGNERKPIYRDDADRERFLGRLAHVVEQQRLVLHAYVLMRNHYHLLLETREANLARSMARLDGPYTQYFNWRHRRVGHLFQGRYKAIVVERDSYMLELSRYIHLNPVRAGEVEYAEQFRWSSAAAYVGKAPAPRFLETDEVLAQFGRGRRDAQRKYAAYLHEKAECPWAKVVGQTLLGGNDWVERMREKLDAQLSSALDDTDRPSAKQLVARPSISQVIAEVARRYALGAEILRRRSRVGAEARAVAIGLCWDLCNVTQSEIGKAFGVGGFAVSKAIQRAARIGSPTARNVRRELNSKFQG